MLTKPLYSCKNHGFEQPDFEGIKLPKGLRFYCPRKLFDFSGLNKTNCPAKLRQGNSIPFGFRLCK